MTMCKALGLEYVLISGYSKGTSYFDGQMPTKTNHAWNAVKIDSQYYLIDSTWGLELVVGMFLIKNLESFIFVQILNYLYVNIFQQIANGNY